MRKAILASILILLALAFGQLMVVVPAHSQGDLKINADWKIVAYAKAYYFFIDMSLIKATNKGTLVAFQLRHARSDTEEGRQAKKEDYETFSKAIGAQKAKRVSHDVSLIEVDCEGHKYRELQVWLEDAKGEHVFDIPSKQVKQKWITPTRESIGDKIIGAVCDAAKSNLPN